MIPMTLEIFLPCYFGSKLSEASSNLSTGLFHSLWINQNEETKAICKVFMENSKKEMKMSAFNMFDLNLTTFKSIVNFAYSLFAVLKKKNS